MNYKFRRKLFGLTNLLLIGFLIFWLTIVSWAAAQQDAKQVAEWNHFSQTLPTTNRNDTAVKLQDLAAELGIFLNLDIPITDASTIKADLQDGKNYQLITEKFPSFLEAQINTPINEIDTLPENLRQYLLQKADVLTSIQTLILNSEAPRWNFNLDNFTFIDELPSFLGFIHLQTMLMVEVLNQYQIGDKPEALKFFHASLILNQVLHHYPLLLSSSLITLTESDQLGILRKIDFFDAPWQKNLFQDDYHQKLINSYLIETLILWRRTRKNIEDPKLLPSFWGPPLWDSNTSLGITINKLLNPFEKPYAQLSLNQWSKQTKAELETMLLTLNMENICQRAQTSLVSGDITRFPLAWWNIFKSEYFFDPFRLVNIAQRIREHLINRELTQKILQIQQVASTTGQFPKTISGIETSSCPDVRWKYQTSSDSKTMTIAIDRKPEWLKDDRPSILPLTYTATLKKDET